MLEGGATACCYAQSEKNGIADPDGVVWEAFPTHGEATVYGDDPGLEVPASTNAADEVCCAPQATPAPVACCG